MSLAGKVAVITGGSKGIGAATARRLASEGANIVLNYGGDKKSADAICEEIGLDQAIAIQADAGTLAGVDQIVECALKKFNKIDILIPAAGILPMRRLPDVTEEEFEKVINVNVKGPLFLVQRAVPHMKNGGRIVLLSSGTTVSTTIGPDYLLYLTSKGGIEQMTRSLNKELMPKGICVNAVAPGPTRSELFNNTQTEASLAALTRFIPQGRIGEPEEVADGIYLLTTEAGRWISGQTIRVNGGMA